jgi:hypothetical protein
MGTTKYNQIEWILSHVNEEDYHGVTLTTPEEKLQFVADASRTEALYPDNIRRYGSVQNCLANWLQGLPTAIQVPYMNWEILELARGWGYDVSTEGKEDRFLANYWTACAMGIIKACRKYKIKLGA